MINFKEFALRLQDLFDKQYEKAMELHGNPFAAADVGNYMAMLDGFQVIIEEINKEAK